MITVGQKVEDFIVQGYQQGKFSNFQLSDYFGKWVFLYFYTGDFNFI